MVPPRLTVFQPAIFWLGGLRLRSSRDDMLLARYPNVRQDSPRSERKPEVFVVRLSEMASELALLAQRRAHYRRGISVANSPETEEYHLKLAA